MVNAKALMRSVRCGEIRPRNGYDTIREKKVLKLARASELLVKSTVINSWHLNPRSR